MKLLTLDLRAFGKFTEHRMDFSQQDKTLHIIYGANEAGKSTSLRALQALFYGFPATSNDDFLHPYAKLAVAAQIQLDQGETYDLLRTKGKTKSLHDAKNQVLDPDLPAQWLGVNQNLFTTMFALDHHSLYLGGEAILAQQGDAGQALFSASIGQQQWHKLLRQLDEEAEELFKPRGKIQTINQLCNEYQEYKKEINKTSLSAHHFQKTEQLYQRSQKDLNSKKTQLKHQQHALKAQERTLRLLPHFKTRQRLLREQQQLSQLPHLEVDFFQQRRDLKRQMDDLAIQQNTVEQQYQQKQQLLADCQPQQEILLQQANIERLYADLAVFKENQQQQSQLIKNIAALEQQLQQQRKAWMPQCSIEAWLEHQPDLIQQQRINILQQEKETLQAEKTQLNQQKQQTASSLQQKTVHIEQLKTLLTQLRGRHELENQQAEKQVEQKKIAVDIQHQWQQLPHCQIPFDRQKILSMRIPDQKVILDMQASYQTLQQQREQQHKERQAYDRQLKDITHHIQTLQQQGHIFTEDEWIQACEKRETIWQTLSTSSAWQEEQSRLFVQALQEADNIARHLYQEAERTREYTQQRAEQARIHEQLDQCAIAHETWKMAQDRWQSQWQQQWSEHIEAITPPQAMLDCLAHYQHISVDIKKEPHIQIELDELTQNIQTIKQQLTSLLPELSPVLPLKIMLEHAESILHKANEQQIKHKQEQQEQQQIHAQETRIAEKDQTWCEQWQQATAGLSPHELAVHEIPLLLQAMHEAQQQQQQLLQYKQQQQQCITQEKLFLQRLQALQVHLPTVPTAPEDQVQQLKIMLDEQKQKHTLFLQYQEDITELTKEQHNIATTQAQHTLRQKQFSHDADGLESDDDFAKLEKDLAEKKRLTQDIQDNLNGIQHDLGSDNLNELETRLCNSDAAQLELDIQTLQEQVATSEQQLGQCHKEYSQAQVAFEQQRGDAVAASSKQDAEILCTEIIENVKKYQRLKLAAMMLKQKMEAYRQANQGDMLTQASSFFRQLTQQSFQSLTTGYNKKEQTVLMGMRADGSTIEVQDMSTGTRDQLYLALRLGYLKKRANQHESVPFIVDDILVHFDDMRSRAAMQTLVDFSAQTQVLMFSHHQYICEIAQAFPQVQVHQL